MWCRNDADPENVVQIPEGASCPAGYSPTYVTPGCAEVCHLGVWQGYCVEFWIAAGLVLLLLIRD